MNLWRSSGYQLLDRCDRGRLKLTDDFLRAYLLRPELAPVEESCGTERSVHASLLDWPHHAIAPDWLQRIEDRDARENYHVFLRFRDHLSAYDHLESAYLALFAGCDVRLPPLFLDQLAHVILCNILAKVNDPYCLRAAECMFRSQKVTLSKGRILLADEEVVEMHARHGGLGSLGRLLVEASAPLRQVELDVLGEDNEGDYLARSDRFDMVLDLSHGRRGLDGLCRVLEAWINHFRGIDTTIQPVGQIRDERWRWHVGLDAEASSILDRLWQGGEPALLPVERLLSLFRLELDDPNLAVPAMAGKPIYLAIAMDKDNRLRMKPQNLLVNLPLAEAS